MSHSYPERPPVMGSADGGHTWRPVQPTGWQEEHGWLARLIFRVRGIPHCNDEAHRRSMARRGEDR